MIPVELILEGIYSYRERTRIDFQPLLDAHLFGIFGSVGSGKSSLLDAITYALYGQVERMNKRDSVAANMFNLDADTAYIRFTFDSLVDGRRYQCLATGKRRKSGPFMNRECFILEADVPVPVTEQTIQDAIGLSYDHFTRTVIVPQGKFQEFLQLSDKDRTEMMQHLFHLHRFDLAGPLRNLIGRTKSHEQHLAGQLETLERILVTPLPQLETERKRLQAEQVAAVQKVRQTTLELEALTTYHRTRIEFDQNQASLQKLLPLIQERTFQLDGLQKQHAALVQKEASLPQLQQLTQQLRLLMDLQSSKHELSELDQKTQIKKQALLPLQEQMKQKRLMLEESNQNISSLLAKRASSETIQERTAWSYQWQQAEQKRLELESSGKEGRFQLDRVKTELQVFWQQHWDPTLFDHALPENPGELIPEWTKNVEANLERIEQEILHVQLQSGLSPFADQLADGQPCPLCGSLDHPVPYTPDQSQDKVRSLTEKKDQKRKALHRMKSLWENSLQLENKIVMQEERLKTLRQEYQNIQAVQARLTPHLENWGLSHDKLTEWLEQQSTYSAQIDSMQKAHHVQQEELQQIEKQYIHQETGVKAHEAEALRLQSRVDTLAEQIGTLDGLETYLERSREELLQTIQQLEQESRAIATAVGDSQKKVQDARDRLQEDQIRKEYFDEQDKQLNGRLEEQNIVLKEAHPDRYAAVADMDTQQAVAKLKEELAALEGQATHWSNQLAVIETQIKDTNLRMEEAVRLKAEFQVVSNKLNNLKTLDTLFRGKGMVDFAASRYLRQILEHANQRFYKMTRHKLRLELGEDNRIMVRDYYHGGALRLVKTLSGGQLFQAALALALSLAEQIRDHRQGDRDFFFLDEGFGTQDRDSLILVLDTLKALRGENRSVGIISHVEDLQQEVNAYLKITLDPVRGSLITASHG
ncbi:MAG: SMC family ATPase [Saprospiraceae bacterium]|nr:SMC family ATPase [Saprospiraceae bacterium]